METPVALTSWLKLLPLLNERQRRLYAAQKVMELEYGGLKQVHQWTGLSKGEQQIGCFLSPRLPEI